MLGNGIKQTTATTGTGSLTLVAAAGYPTLANVFAVGQPFSYTLLDSNGLFLEAGIGVLTSSTVMARSLVTATFNGTTYTNTGATAASLTGTTTVICATHAATVAAAPWTVDGFNSGVGRYIASSGTTNQRSTYALGASMFYIPFQSDFGCVATSMAINVVTGVAGNAQLGIYAMGAQGQPGKLLASTAAFDVSTTGWKKPALSVPVFMPSGFYYVALASTPAITVTAIDISSYNTQAGPSTLGFVGDSFTPVLFRYGTLLMPSDATAIATNVAGVNHPAILIGVA